MVEYADLIQVDIVFVMAQNLSAEVHLVRYSQARWHFSLLFKQRNVLILVRPGLGTFTRPLGIQKRALRCYSFVVFSLSSTVFLSTLLMSLPLSRCLAKLSYLSNSARSRSLSNTPKTASSRKLYPFTS